MTPDDFKQRERAHRDLIRNLQRISTHIQPTHDFADRVMRAAQLHQFANIGLIERIRNHARFTSSITIRVASVTVMVLALLGAIPQYYRWVDSFLLGVSSNQIYEAKLQETLWEKNFACATQLDQRADSYAAITNDHVVVVTWACPSGDVLITLESPTDETSRRSVWIPLMPMHRKSVWLDLLMPDAYAAKHPLHVDKRSAQMVTVLCQKWLPNRFIKRRIQLADSHCVEEVINPRTGQVVQRQKASCESHCS